MNSRSPAPLFLRNALRNNFSWRAGNFIGMDSDKKKVSIGMAGNKGVWWMPRLEKAMKDAA